MLVPYVAAMLNSGPTLEWMCYLRPLSLGWQPLHVNSSADSPSFNFRRTEHLCPVCLHPFLRVDICSPVIHIRAASLWMPATSFTRMASEHAAPSHLSATGSLGCAHD